MANRPRSEAEPMLALKSMFQPQMFNRSTGVDLAFCRCVGGSRAGPLAGNVGDLHNNRDLRRSGITGVMGWRTRPLAPVAPGVF